MLPTKEERDSIIRAAKKRIAKEVEAARKAAIAEEKKREKELQEKLKREKESSTEYVFNEIRKAINDGQTSCEVSMRNHTNSVIKDIVAEINTQAGYKAELIHIRTEEYEYTNYESGAGQYHTYHIPHIKVSWE
jgi:hypothetical protein